MKAAFFLLFASLLLSCTSKPVNETDLQRRNVETFFDNSGFVRYFLPELPDWANYSTSGQCFRQKRVRYYDISALRVSFFIDYEQAVQQQLTFNQLISRNLESEYKKYVSLEDEERYFFEASEKVQSGIKTFRKPVFKTVHVVWIDRVMNDPKKLKKLMNSSRMEKGHPVFLSMCLSRSEVSDYLRKHKLDNRNIRIISQEMFTPFDQQNNRLPMVALDLGALFDQKQKILFFNPVDNKLPLDILGKYKVYKF